MTGGRRAGYAVALLMLPLLPRAPMAAQEAGGTAGGAERWAARLLAGIALQGPSGQYAQVGFAVGGVVAYRAGRRIVFRLDVQRARFIARCADAGAGGIYSRCITRTASDAQTDLFLGAGAEFALERRGVFARVSLGGLRHAGVALNDAGWHPAASLALGLRFSDLVAFEASAVPATGTGGGERWRFPLLIVVGPVP